MTDWREELIEKMAKAAAECGHKDWMYAEDWFKNIYIGQAIAALAVAEPVIREQCAKMADKMGVISDGHEVADAIREGGRDDI